MEMFGTFFSPKRNQDWIITRDHLEGVINKKKSDFQDHEKYVIPFKLFDDDDNLYFEGWLTQELYDQGEAVFAPLDDYGMPGYGCTYMKIKLPGESWVMV